MTHFLHRDGRLRTIVSQKVNQEIVFCWEKKSIKMVYIKLEPQPSEHELLEVHRLSRTRKASV